jgi:L-ascorbate metabolism protein UlaG (beta-lactamase superfamily)
MREDNAGANGAGHVKVRWHGHATVSIRDSGTTILTDPVLTNRVAHLRRRRGEEPGHAVRSPDAVVLSHLHGDHTHIPSLQLIDREVPIVLPAGAADKVRGLRAFDHRLVPVKVGDQVEIGPLSIRVVPAEHDGRRWPRGNADTEALGYVIEGSARTYFAGDTEQFPEMAEHAGDCDLALIPVGGWGPNLGPGHLNPQSAAEAVAQIRARSAVPIHFGTLWPIGLDRVRPERFYGPGTEFVSCAQSNGVDAVELEPGGRHTVSAGAPRSAPAEPAPRPAR